MIRDPLLNKQALMMYRAYLFSFITSDIEDVIDYRTLSFDEWVKENEIFKDNWD